MIDSFEPIKTRGRYGMPKVIHTPWEARRALRESSIPAHVFQDLHWRPVLNTLHYFCIGEISDVDHVRWMLSSAFWLSDL